MVSALGSRRAVRKVSHREGGWSAAAAPIPFLRRSSGRWAKEPRSSTCRCASISSASRTDFAAAAAAAKVMFIRKAGYRKNIRAFGLPIQPPRDRRDERLRRHYIVAASGNESERPNFTITVAPPVAGDLSFIAVVIDRRRGIAPFSNDEVDLVAPASTWSAAPAAASGQIAAQAWPRLTSQGSPCCGPKRWPIRNVA